MERTNHRPDDLLRNSQLGAIVDEILDSIRNGQVLTTEEWIKRYPDFSADLAELIPTLAFVEVFQQHATSTGHDVSAANEARDSSLWGSDQVPKQLGDFQLLAEIGRGGMGIVYSAWQVSQRRPVALKVLARHLTRDPRFIARFQLESQSAARLHHPHVVQIYSSGHEHGIWYYAMQLVDGSTVSQVLDELRLMNEAGLTSVQLPTNQSSRRCAESLLTADLTIVDRIADIHTARNSVNDCGTKNPNATLPQPDRRVGTTRRGSERRGYYDNVARLVRDAANAIHYAHLEGMVHRDIKPANLMIDQNGKVWITDFGLAKIQDESGLTVTGDLIGTLRYTAPEQLDGVTAPSCDVYSLGLTLYELLTFQPAIASPDKLSILYQVRHREPTPPRIIAPQIPSPLEFITLKAIAKRPGNRYATAKDLADDLQRFLDGRATLAKPITSFDRTVNWARDNRLVAILLLSLLLGLVVTSVGSTIAAWRFRDLARREADSRSTADSALLQANASLQRATIAEAEIRQQLYVSDMQFGLQAAELPGSLPKLRSVVERWKDSDETQGFKGWEWHLLNSLSQQEVFQLNIEARYQSRMAISADRRRMAWIDEKEIVLFDVDARQVIRRIDAQRTPIAIELSPNFDRVFVALDDSHIDVLCTETGKQLQTQLLPRLPRAVAWHPSGQMLAMSVPNQETGRGDLFVWTLASNEVRMSVEQKLVNDQYAIAFNSDGSRLIASRAAEGVGDFSPFACVWDSNNWVVEQEVHLEGRNASSFAWSPDQRLVAIGTFDGDALIWDMQSHQIDARIKLLSGVNDVDWHPDGQSICIACDDASVHRWSLTTRELSPGPLPHSDQVVFARYTHADEHLISLDRSEALRIWDLQHGMVEQQVQLVDQFDAHQVDVLVQFSPDDNRLSMGAAAPAVVWNIDRGVVDKSILGSYLNWSFDGRYLASKFREKVTVWNATNFEEVTAHEGLGYGLLRVWSPIDNRLAGNNSDRLWVWDIESNEVKLSSELLTQRGPDGFKCLAWSPDGSRIAVAVDDLKLYVLAADTLAIQKRYEPTSAMITALAWSPDGEYLGIAAAEPTAYLFSVETGKVIKRLDAHTYQVRVIAWSPDGRRIATGGADRKLMVWNPEWEQPVLSTEFDDEIRSVAWSHDGRALAGLTQSGQMKLWRLKDASASP